MIYVPDLLEKLYPGSLHDEGQKNLESAVLRLEKLKLARWSKESNGNFIYLPAKGRELAEIYVKLDKSARKAPLKTLPSKLDSRLDLLKKLLFPSAYRGQSGWYLLVRLQQEEEKRSSWGNRFFPGISLRQLGEGASDKELLNFLESLAAASLIERKKGWMTRREGWRLTSLGQDFLLAGEPVAACKITLEDVRLIIQSSIDLVQQEVQEKYTALKDEHNKFLDECSQETALEKEIKSIQGKLQSLTKQIEKAKKETRKEALQRTLRETAFKLQLLEKQHQAHQKIQEHRAQSLAQREANLDVFHQQANLLTGHLLDSMVRVEALTRSQETQPQALLGSATLWNNAPSLREILERVLGVLEGGAPSESMTAHEAAMRQKLERIQAREALQDVMQQVGIAPPKATETPQGDKASDEQAKGQEDKQEALKPSSFPDLSASDSLSDFGGARRG